MLAALAPDLDGISLLWGVAAYQTWHHRIGHNVFFALLVVVLASRYVGRGAPASARAGALCRVALSLALHLVGDFFGSGPGWGLHLLWPVSDAQVLFRGAWEFNAWPNTAVTFLGVLYVTHVARTRGITPLEFLLPDLDRTLCDRLQLGSHTPCTACPPGEAPRSARVRCHRCREALCLEHALAETRHRYSCRSEACAPGEAG